MTVRSQPFSEDLPERPKVLLVDDDEVNLLLTSVARLGAQLAEARVKNDMQSVRHAVHTLKSSSASIGALRLSRLCAEIEAAVRQEAFAGLPSLLDDVDRELVVVLQALLPMRAAG